MEEGEPKEEQLMQNWSEKVEDLVAASNINAAISLMETVVSKLEAASPSETVNLQLAAALEELSKLYSVNHFSLKSDELLSRASLLRQRALLSLPESGSPGDTKNDLKEEDKVSKSNASVSCDDLIRDGSSMNGNFDFEESSKQSDDACRCNGSSDDDWEAIADRAPSELLLSEGLPSVSNLSLEDTKIQGPKRRGRGTFLYKQDELYSDRQSDMSFSGDTEVEDMSKSKQQNTESIHSKYGTHHVLVLADFPPSTRTIELEKLFQNFTDHVVIRWVSDTMALAVFQTPTIALEAQNHIKFPFTVRILDEDDTILDSIPLKDLEPPHRRPQTSTRTAQRLIAQGMGLKLPSTTFGSRELKNQEEDRKNRILTRQKMIEDAWGDDT